MPKSIAITILVSTLLCSAGPARAGTWHVEQDGSGDFTRIQPAVDAAASGDTIRIGPGTYGPDAVDLDPGYAAKIAAFWDDPRNLVFIGAGADRVKISALEPPSPVTLTAGIVHLGPAKLAVTVRGIAFDGLINAIYAEGGADVRECVFRGHINAVSIGKGSLGRVTGCTFADIFNAACQLYSLERGEIIDCRSEGFLNLVDVADGAVRDCRTTAWGFCYLRRASALVADNTFACNTGAGASPCVTAIESGNVTIRGNALHGGNHALQVDGALVRVRLEGNEISGQSSHGLLLRGNAVVAGSGNDIRKAPPWNVYLVRCEDYGGDEPQVIDLEDNYWGYTSTYALDVYIWDHADDPETLAIVDYEPFATGSVPAVATGWGALRASLRGKPVEPATRGR